MSTNKKFVYNLEFPSWCKEITISDYHFYRVEEYKEKVRNLQHLANSKAEFDLPANTGSHEITAFVECPSTEPKAILKWLNKDASSLQDILFLLSIFTRRDVFIVEEDKNNLTSPHGPVIVSDPRSYYWGGILRCSIPYEPQNIEPKPNKFDIGFEKGINQIYNLIKSEDWQVKYKGGYFLFLVRAALRRQILESSFIQCWTIWEHLFSILNQNWMSEAQIRKLDSVEKISFILIEFALAQEINKKSKNRIMDLASIRNRLIHFGKFPDRDNVLNDAEFFIRLTEFVIAKVLGLLPSNVFNTVEKLENFLFNQTNK
jgi:hypothetical protein